MRLRGLALAVTRPSRALLHRHGDEQGSRLPPIRDEVDIDYFHIGMGVAVSASVKPQAVLGRGCTGARAGPGCFATLAGWLRISTDPPIADIPAVADLELLLLAIGIAQALTPDDAVFPLRVGGALEHV
jgi:hypothetical protein